MHVLAIDSGAIDTGDEAVDLGQTPADIVVLSAADTELGLLARAYRHWSQEGAVRALAEGDDGTEASRDRSVHVRPDTASGKPHGAASQLLGRPLLRGNAQVLPVDRCPPVGRAVLLAIRGGADWWPWRVSVACRLRFCPATTNPIHRSAGSPRLRPTACFICGAAYAKAGTKTRSGFWTVRAATLREAPIPIAPRAVASAGLYRSVDAAFEDETGGRAAVIFYRALFQSGDLAPIEALIAELVSRRLSVDAFYVMSLKDEVSRELLTEMFEARPPDVILNATAFAAGLMGDHDPLSDRAEIFGSDAPWLQVVLSGQTEAAWAENAAGLTMRDIAMHVALPEFDGRLLTRAVSFKTDGGRDTQTELPMSRAEPKLDRLRFTCDLAANWAGLRRVGCEDRRIGLVLANYPNRDGRIANGVGLATPESAVVVLRALSEAGYDVAGAPDTDADLIAQLKSGPTNAAPDRVSASEHVLPMAAYQGFLASLPADARTAVLERWGAPEDDPFVTPDKTAFAISVQRFGNVVVGIQPARGYNIDPKATYHDPALVPPHAYLAFYLWLRAEFGADAVVHLGKHGNQEWLPGKALALSQSCWPEIALQATPNIYPFIVNDPGEGAQAKRRASAVIIDHLMPPMVRAETYGTAQEPGSAAR